MKVSELIAVLQNYQREYGDHEVVDIYDESVGLPEMVEDVCVLCDKA